jgi:hypothetical protein
MYWCNNWQHTCVAACWITLLHTLSLVSVSGFQFIVWLVSLCVCVCVCVCAGGGEIAHNFQQDCSKIPVLGGWGGGQPVANVSPNPSTKRCTVKFRNVYVSAFVEKKMNSGRTTGFLLRGNSASNTVYHLR